jgi:hypothetical protein
MKTRSKTLLLIILAGLTVNAHALCVNPDGTLDDASMSPSTIAVEMLPACETPASKTVDLPAHMKTPNTGKQPMPESNNSDKKGKNRDKTAQIKSDCRTNNGDSQQGYLGATDMLPECGS